MATAKFTFLEEQILAMLDSNGLSNLSEENKKEFLPQLSAEAEYRLGLALMPLLNEQQGAELVKLIDREAGPEELSKFWENAVPNLKEIISNTLADFAEECKTILSR